MNEKSTYFKIGAVSLYIILLITMDSIFRDKLFSFSLTFEKNFQTDSPGMKEFFKFISTFGQSNILLPIFFLIFFIMPLNKVFTYISVYLLSLYWDNILKIIYNNPRPYWIDQSLFIQCSGGYGNPSGHSLGSCASYLALCHLFTEYKWFKENTTGIITRCLLFGLTLIFIFTIMLSRLFLGVHSIDQVLYGFTLGLSLYYIFFHIIKLQEYTSKQFFEQFNKPENIAYWFIFFAVHFIFALIIIFSISPDNSNYIIVNDKLCPNLPAYFQYQMECIGNMLYLFGLVGAYCGLCFVCWLYPTDYNSINESFNKWNNLHFFNFILSILICILFCFPLIIPLFVSKDSSVIIYFIFSIFITYSFLFFNTFGPFLCLLKKMNIIEESQTEKDEFEDNFKEVKIV